MVANPFTKRKTVSLILLPNPFVDFRIWDEAKHPRDKKGRFGHHSDSVDVGVTPYRGKARAAPPGSTDSYYSSTRYKGFSNQLKAQAAEHNVEILGEEKTSGIWEGKYEPALGLQVSGVDSDIDDFAKAIARRYNQDAVMEWHPDSKGSDAYYTITGVEHSTKAGESMAAKGFPGGSFTSKGLEIADFGAGNIAAALELTKELGGTLKVEPGRFSLIEQ